MRPAKNEKPVEVPGKKIELNIDLKVAQQLEVMADYSKISRDELATIALKRFIVAHNDYFPPDYKA